MKKIPWIWWSLLGLTLASVTGIFLWESTNRRAAVPALPILGRVENFTLRNQNDQPVTRQDLLGRSWIADFIYTSCPDQCPMMSRQMEVIQGMIPKEAPVQLVSISVDPKRDAPRVLAAYAKKFHYEAARWHFLTGPPEEIKALTKSFMLPQATPNTKNEIDHSNRLILVDTRSRIRGYYDGTDEQAVKKLIHDVSQLSTTAP